MHRLRMLFPKLSRTSHSVPRITSQVSAMTSYTYTVSTAPGTAPEDAQAHHVKGHDGQIVSFKNPNPSYGIFRNINFFQGISMYLR